EIIFQDHRAMYGSAPNGVVSLKVNAGSLTGAEHIAVEIFRFAQIMNANSAVADCLEVGHDFPPAELSMKYFLNPFHVCGAKTSAAGCVNNLLQAVLFAHKDFAGINDHASVFCNCHRVETQRPDIL